MGAPQKDVKVMPELEDISVPQIHVLVVDDNPVDRKMVERLLKHHASYKVTAVESGSKALEVLAFGNNNINLIITDYCMPEMCGYELLRHVKETPSLEEIPVVIMSSENDANRIQRCLEEGAEEFILKPVRLADVKRLKSYVHLEKQNLVELPTASCNKRKFNSEGFQAQSPERQPPRLRGVIVA